MNTRADFHPMFIACSLSIFRISVFSFIFYASCGTGGCQLRCLVSYVTQNPVVLFPRKFSVWLRTNPEEHVSARRAATEGLVDAIEEAVAENGQGEPVGGVEIGRKLRTYAPTVRSGRAQHDLVAYGQAQDANRRR